jgi:DNA-binding response OmpR family regulator
VVLLVVILVVIAVALAGVRGMVVVEAIRVGRPAIVPVLHLGEESAEENRVSCVL